MFLINNQIKDGTVKVLSNNEEFLGNFSKKEAIQMAQKQDLDLICINPNLDVPLCKLADYGRFLYENKKKQKEHKPKIHEIKEIQLNANTGIHDLEIKAKRVKKFFDDGNRVKIILTLRGREVSNGDVAMNTFTKFLEMIHPYAIEKDIAKTSNSISIFVKSN